MEHSHIIKGGAFRFYNPLNEKTAVGAAVFNKQECYSYLSNKIVALYESVCKSKSSSDEPFLHPNFKGNISALITIYATNITH